MFRLDLVRVVELARGDPIVAIHNGDLCHGDRYPEQLVGTRRADQVLIAVSNVQPILGIPNVTALRLVQGTASHSFKEATAPILATQVLRFQYPGKDVKTLRHGLASVDGVTVDYAHHGPSPGIRQWTHGNQLRYYLKSLMNDEIARGRRPPRIVIRSHFHAFCWETVRMATAQWGMVTSDIFVTPSYCGLSEYGQQATRSAYLLAAKVFEGGLATLDGGSQAQQKAPRGPFGRGAARFQAITPSRSSRIRLRSVSSMIWPMLRIG